MGYDGELGLCICKEPSGRATCGGLCRRRSASELKLQCQSNGEMELLWSYGGQVSEATTDLHKHTHKPTYLCTK